MPTLAYYDQDISRAGPLTGRALIGRRLSHGVVLADAGVSRLHAWVEPTDAGGWAVTDAGSKSGTFVNDQPIYRRELVDGDTIRIGSTRVTFRAGDDLPAGAEPVALSPPPGEPVRTGGILFACGNCRAPIWVGNDLAGKRGRCRHCKQQIVVPAAGEPVERATPAPLPPLPPTAPGRRPQCGVCHAAVAATETVTVCPECDTTYHGECWDENYGCSTYGCGQVNALNPAAKAAAATLAAAAPTAAPTADFAVTPEADEPRPDLAAVTNAEPYADVSDEPTVDAPPPRHHWELVTVLAAVLASALGAISFGVPALAMAAVAAAMIVRRKADTRVALLVVAVVVAVVGVAAGVILSDYLWLAGKHLP